jgi:cold shock CspA family protein
MIKAMVFVDGTWLYSSTPRLAEDSAKPDLHIDYGLLPKVLAEKVAAGLRVSELDVVRTNLFGSYAVNYDLRDEEAVQRRLDFFSMLREEFHYAVEVFSINFRGRRLRKKDRDPGDDFEPREKCVDIALATSLLYNAAIPHAYDVAIVVVGDRDYVPVLEHVRRLAKRVAIVSIRGCCAAEYIDPEDRARVRDADVLWLNDIVGEIELTYEPRALECQSYLHVGEKSVLSTFRPRKGQFFYCDECRARFTEQKAEAEREFVAGAPGTEASEPRSEPPQGAIAGRVERVLADKGYGFLKGGDGRQYFFHLTDLEGILWREVAPGVGVSFQVKKEPAGGKAGAAGTVRAMEAEGQGSQD